MTQQASAVPVVITMSGNDPSGGAGIQADLKVFALFGVYGMALPAALTAQNTVKVFSVKSRPAASVREELETLLSDIRPEAGKTGMLYSAGVISEGAVAARRGVGGSPAGRPPPAWTSYPLRTTTPTPHSTWTWSSPHRLTGN